MMAIKQHDKVMRYLKAHPGEKVNKETISEALGIKASSAGTVLAELYRHHKDIIKKFGPGVYYYESAKRPSAKRPSAKRPLPSNVVDIPKRRPAKRHSRVPLTEDQLDAVQMYSIVWGNRFATKQIQSGLPFGDVIDKIAEANEQPPFRDRHDTFTKGDMRRELKRILRPSIAGDVVTTLGDAEARRV